MLLTKAAQALVSCVTERHTDMAADGLEREGQAAATRGRGWRTAPEVMPSHWPEREDISAQAVEAARKETLRYISRRRACAEEPGVLLERELPRTDDEPTIRRAEPSG